MAEPMEMLEVVDSAGYSWGEVKPPSPSLPSAENAHLIPPDPVSVRTKHVVLERI